jgi:HD-GYP domain-containing protein (c-di-GMP phosphodiesterase class II)
VPVKVRGETIGVLNVTNRASGRPFDEHDRRLLEMLAGRVARVLGKLRSYGDSKDEIGRMERALRGIIDVRRHYFPSGESFSRLVVELCEELELPAEETARIHYASVLRDVGMIRLPEGVYKKPAALSREDRKLVERHPEEGAEVLRAIEFLPDVFDIILSHHEGPAGTGYPRGLRGEGIPRGARILAVLDAYHALRSGRPYRAAVGAEEAVAELRRHAGSQFDATVVEALVRVLRRRGELPNEAGREERPRVSETETRGRS